MSKELVTEQTPPKPSKGDIWLLVLQDMEERRKGGIEKYGTPLQAFNGRDPLVDAYQEALDLCVYLRQAIEETRVNNRCPAIIKGEQCCLNSGHENGHKWAGGD